MPADRPPVPTVAYVCGVGHSGSTLLDRLLGAREGAWSGGELKRFSASRWASRWRAKGWPAALEEPCACGALTLRACSFWRAVDARLAADGLGLDALDVYAPNPGRFARDNMALFRAIGHASGAAVVVDSSKDLARLRRLQVETELRVVPVWLVRRTEGVVYSEARRGRPWLAAAAATGYAQLAFCRYLRGRPHHVVRYRALCTDPDAALAPLVADLGLGRTREVTPHLAFGNPMRLRPLGAVRPDDAWRTGLSRTQRVVLGLLHRPVAQGWTAAGPLYRALGALARETRP